MLFFHGRNVYTKGTTILPFMYISHLTCLGPEVQLLHYKMSEALQPSMGSPVVWQYCTIMYIYVQFMYNYVHSSSYLFRS